MAQNERIAEFLENERDNAPEELIPYFLQFEEFVRITAFHHVKHQLTFTVRAEAMA